MLRLLRYLKPYLLLILLTIVLLFVQAMAELALPDYLSKIVNVGIQQGGVENAVPEAIRQSSLDHVLIFVSPDEKEMILNSYILVDQNSPDYEQYLQDYPALANEPIYVLHDLDQAQIDQLDQIMAEPVVIVYNLELAMADPEKAAAFAEGSPFDLSKLPPGADIFTLFAQMPKAMQSQMTQAISEKFSGMSDSAINQMAAAAIQAEYKAIGIDVAQLQTSYILRMGSVMLLISLLSGACMIITGYWSALTAAGAARDIRRDVFKKVESFSSTEFDKFSTASLITRSTNDVTQVQMVIFMTLRMVFYAPIIGIGGVIRALDTDASMWWIIAAAVVALLTLIIIVFSIALPKFKIIQSLIDKLNLVTRENLSGMMVIRAFNKQQFETVRFDRANRDLTDTSLFISRIMVTVMPLMMFIMNFISLLIIWVGSHQVAQANMQVGDMMAFMQYAMQILFSFLMLSMMIIFLPRAAVSGGRIADVLETEIVIRDSTTPQAFPEPFTGRVEFREVSFRYPDAQEDVLCEITFSAEPGQTTAIIGSTGSGKSTMINLIPRFYDVTKGAITIDGMDIRQVRQNDLRDKIGFIPQKANLFTGTIESNLLYADKNASPETLHQAADIAQASEFIFSEEAGLQTQIAQGGANVSGGQKQRLAIARALVKKPPIYIFDDSFSALDYKTDSALRRALKEKTGNSTVLIVTQRVATIKNADQIVVLDEGQVVGKGKHHDLMESCEVYREIAYSQLTKEELQ
jgi:ATP-binding cassette, subfamily B, multidrug efflux pump